MRQGSALCGGWGQSPPAGGPTPHISNGPLSPGLLTSEGPPWEGMSTFTPFTEEPLKPEGPLVSGHTTAEPLPPMVLRDALSGGRGPRVVFILLYFCLMLPLFPTSPLLSEEGHHLPGGQEEPTRASWLEELEPQAGSLGIWWIRSRMFHHPVPRARDGKREGQAQGVPQPDTFTAALSSTLEPVWCAHTLTTCERKLRATTGEEGVHPGPLWSSLACNHHISQ